ncbi:hypothetical protein PSN45_004273 [Yamadazyma tenuis]|uniref:Protein GLC8 n=1 Tax=Candida tenuis (strain ATCC 10573 / BCRC 21748 / CBS 615 / JCM 9827 / NBRC 10315 / NRRL Y-1498 / VKM Y-70) TaxID=590646 RepID=G3B6D7_CANTC|nr:uncharacterized protein CANTEDRAFT_94195 [Yamadazyma tenuis ATCC 10573]EGV63442.1 hypothetical protein CANTEDRAFT_94195 [Yamadazyma tenuis ATCC 10573]WEJ96730.1 hypothetical protein PSN45_004273 [Yamadazyma tenuis]
MDEPRGILRNKAEVEPKHTSSDKLDRQEVIRNTRLNSNLAQNSNSKGDLIRNKIAVAKKQQSDQGKKTYPDHLKWDEVNLYQTEQEKAATMKIDEPKTPYERGFDPTGEYYQDDDEEEIPGFELGESAEHDTHKVQSLGGGEILQDQNAQQDEPEPEKPLTAKEKHQKFEEMRKQHYHLKGSVLGKKIEVSDDEE